jgi:hypothetical protein
MSRIEAGALKPNRQWLSLAEVVAHTLQRLRLATAQHTLAVEVSDDLPPVPADYGQLDQVFTNLFSNSLKYAPPGTTIAVRARLLPAAGPAAAPEAVQVTVQNDGPPIPPEHLLHIFDKFYWRHRRRPGHWHRLGLPSAKALSRPTVGAFGPRTCRTACLQLHAPAQSAGVPPQRRLPETEADEHPRPHILVIDDEPQILRALRTILLEKKFRVTTASRGEEGLTLAAANPPDHRARPGPARYERPRSLRPAARLDPGAHHRPLPCAIPSTTKWPRSTRALTTT